MMKCEIIHDLLLLYCDGQCSKAIRQEIEAHVAQREECRACLADIKEAGIAPSIYQSGQLTNCSLGQSLILCKVHFRYE